MISGGEDERNNTITSAKADSPVIIVRDKEEESISSAGNRLQSLRRKRRR